ncbi:hypothetical protein HHL16_14650 [Pseudoflavitalea sp. G-6-1-2]|uniref:hypothetical protein n=1 Tax=Pseudoflavitalea sp. G-6-1-2 TaxID=2728841 RepID=UPI00146B37F2|nr:hypothetical protein [Pseudoflavitalea sp. G-6-1-2]NML22120.1 hypothetical protein [Pseudoflavitalea sp. G-6-1-2]
MNDQSQHITHYTAADIRRYLNGSMSAAEMHAMELAALDDPFLSDAIEGMEATIQSHGEAIIQTKLQEIGQAVEARIHPEGGKVRKMVWWRMAAAAVVIIAGGLFVWNSFFKPEGDGSSEKTLAVKQKEAAPDTVVPAPQATQPAQNNELPSDLKTADAGIDKQQLARTEESQIVKDALPHSANKAVARKLPAAETARAYTFSTFSDQAVTAEPIKPDSNMPAIVAAPENKLALTNQILNKKLELNFSDTLNRITETEVIQGALQGHAKGLVTTNVNPKEKAKLQNVIRGRVFDQFNQPIANAYLQAQQSPSAIFQNQPSQISSYLTDKDGYFTIPTNELDTALKVSVGAVGYSTKNFDLAKNSQSNMLQLQSQNIDLNEVVVTGMARRRSSKIRKVASEASSIIKQNAEPAYGWITYNKYLQDNVRKSVAGSTSGDVLVSFSVNRKGELSEFTILRSLTEAADNEAIRLIKDGPGWKISKGRKATATVTVHF